MCVAKDRFNKHRIKYFDLTSNNNLRPVISETFNNRVNQRMYLKGDFCRDRNGYPRDCIKLCLKRDIQVVHRSNEDLIT